MKLLLCLSAILNQHNIKAIRPIRSSCKRAVLLVSFLFLYAGSQEQTITLNKKHISAEKVITAIQKQSGYNLFYAADVLQHVKKTNVAFDKLSLTQALDAAVNAQPFTYELIGKTIVLKNRVAHKPVKSISYNGNVGNEEPMVNNGYQKISKRQSTGSSSEISREEIERNPTSNMLQLLSNLPGVIVQGDKITIRGATSLMSSTDPLIIVDGISYPASSINSLDPNMIQDITVLKDGAETAIYGSRGSNGVIVIASRQGGKTVHNYNDLSSIKVNRDGSIRFNKTHLSVLMMEICKWYGLIVSFAPKSSSDNYYGLLTRDIPLNEMLYILESAGISLKHEGKIILVTD